MWNDLRMFLYLSVGLALSLAMPFGHVLASWAFSPSNRYGRPRYGEIVTDIVGWPAMAAIAAAYACLFCVVVPVLTAL